MRLFRRARDTKTSVLRREAVSAVAEAPAMSTVARTSSTSPIAPVVESQPQLPTDTRALQDVLYDGNENSDVFLCKDARVGATSLVPAAPAQREVTLFVHGWHNVEPGLLSWTFPSLRAALDAVQRMKNAIGWCVVSGTGWSDLEAARARGAILVEQLA